jgi:hypothetical protein
LTDGSANIVPGTWADMGGGLMEFRYTSAINDYYARSSTATTTTTISTPSGEKTKAMLVAGNFSDTTPDYQAFWIGDPDETITNNGTGHFLITTNEKSSVCIEVFTNTSSQIKHKAEQTGGGSYFYISTIGYQYKR